MTNTKNSNQFSLRVAVLTCSLLAVVLSCFAMTNLEESFDWIPVGKPPSGWNLCNTGFAVVTNGIPQSGSNCLMLVNVKAGEPACALKALDPMIPHNAGDSVFVSFHVRLPQQTAAINIMLTSADTWPLVTVGFNNGGRITATSGDKSLDLADYNVDLWYQVHLLVSPPSGTFDLTIRAGSKEIVHQKGLSMRKPKTDSDFVYFYLQNYGMPDGHGAVFMDQVSVVWPAPL